MARRPPLSRAVRRGLLQMLAKSGNAVGRDEQVAQAFVKHVGAMNVLRPNNPSGPPPKRKRKTK